MVTESATTSPGSVGDAAIEAVVITTRTSAGLRFRGSEFRAYDVGFSARIGCRAAEFRAEGLEPMATRKGLQKLLGEERYLCEGSQEVAKCRKWACAGALQGKRIVRRDVSRCCRCAVRFQYMQAYLDHAYISTALVA